MSKSHVPVDVHRRTFITDGVSVVGIHEAEPVSGFNKVNQLLDTDGSRESSRSDEPDGYSRPHEIVSIRKSKHECANKGLDAGESREDTDHSGFVYRQVTIPG